MKLKANISEMEAYIPGRTIPGAVKLSSNENPLGPSPLALRAIREALDGVHRYPDGSASGLKSRLTEKWKLPDSSFLVANGSDEVFALLCAAWIGPGENAVSSLETFSQYAYAVRLFGAEFRKLPLDEGFYDLDGILSRVDSRTRMIFLCNPNNPTGTYRNHRDVADFLEKIDSDIIVVLDEAYAEFADAPDFPDSKLLMEKFPNLVVTRTFSKLYGLAGLRVGYAIGNRTIIEGAERASMPFNVNNLAQAAAVAALDDEGHLKKTLTLVRKEKQFLETEFDRRGIFRYPTQANFLCFRVNQDSSALWGPIAKKGIALRALTSFGLPDMFRYTFGRREDNIKLLEILDELLPAQAVEHSQ